MYELSKQMEDLAKAVIKKNQNLAHLADCKIKYLQADFEKKRGKKIIFGDCQRITGKQQALVEADFVITFYQDANYLSEKAYEILMYHELKHVGYGDGECWIEPHDVEDFRDIIEKYGIDWHRM